MCVQSHVISMNEVATKSCKKHKVNPGSARLLNNSFAQTAMLQLLPAKHAKCHAVVVANAALLWDSQQPDVQTVEAALLMRELQVTPSQTRDSSPCCVRDDLTPASSNGLSTIGVMRSKVMQGPKLMLPDVLVFSL